MFDTNKYEENLLLYNLRGDFDDSISILNEKNDNLIDTEKIKDKSKKIFYIYQIKKNPKKSEQKEISPKLILIIKICLPKN